MTRNDIIRIAREARIATPDEAMPNLERFAALVADEEREACAKVCDSLGGDIDPRDPDEVRLAANSLADAIRKRGAKPLKHEGWCDATGAWGQLTACDCGADKQLNKLFISMISLLKTSDANCPGAYRAQLY